MPESTGTITLTNGSASVTGSGTLFADNFVGANDVLIVDGLMYVIASVSSNAALTLTRPYTGATASGKQYDIVHLTGEDALNELARQVAALVNKYGVTVNSITDTPGASKIPKAGADGKLADDWLSAAALLKCILAFDGESSDTLAAATNAGDVVIKGADGIVEILERLSSGLDSKAKLPMLDDSQKIPTAQLPLYDSTPQKSTDAGSSGTSNEVARGDHVHPRGPNVFVFTGGETDTEIQAATLAGDLIIRKVTVSDE